MIIDRYGNILDSWRRDTGELIFDGDFAIGLEYNSASKIAYKQIYELKKKLGKTDYKALKHADGEISDEEYECIKEERQSWRDEINKLEAQMTIPTITKEEIAEAEAKAIASLGGVIL